MHKTMLGLFVLVTFTPMAQSWSQQPTPKQILICEAKGSSPLTSNQVTKFEFQAEPFKIVELKGKSQRVPYFDDKHTCGTSTAHDASLETKCETKDTSTATTVSVSRGCNVNIAGTRRSMFHYRAEYATGVNNAGGFICAINDSGYGFDLSNCQKK